MKHDGNNSLNTGIDIIKEYAKRLPKTPGVYRMLGESGKVLYVGKAKALKNRVMSYTRPDGLSLRLKRMISETISMEFVTTHTEAEALLLEANLIKNLEPRYNVLLRDDKNFSYIHITDHNFPLVHKHRESRKGGGNYYGPFASTQSVNATLDTLHKAFLLRSCEDTVFANRTRPCLQYQIKRCSAPCVGKISIDDYAKLVSECKDFLNGKSSSIQKNMAQEMEDASSALEFEKAAELRDRIKALTQVQSKQVINSASLKDSDVFAVYGDGESYAIQYLLFRNGSNFGSYNAFISNGKDADPADILSTFIAQFYESTTAPREVLVNIDGDFELLEKALSTRHGIKIAISRPTRGHRRKLIQYAETNAEQAFERKQLEKANDKKLLKEVASIFEMDSPPQRIEVYDMSHVQGSFPVGVMVVAGEEGFIKNAYRKFNIKSQDLTPGDDYAMMKEVLSRRFRRAMEKDGQDWPDLVLIDGGKGQLSAVTSVFNEMGVSDVTLVAISKGPDRNAGREEFHMNGRKSFRLPMNSPALYYLQRLRDESHRFAIGTHRSKRQKSLSYSSIDNIPGVGSARKQALLRHFGSKQAISSAGIEDLAMVDGISRSMAKKIYDFFNNKG